MWQNCVFVWVCVNLLYVKFVCAKIWYVCVKLLYVEFVCVCDCVWSSGMWVSAGGGGRRRSPGYRIKIKNPTPHKVVGKNWEKLPFFKSPCSSKIPIFEVSWIDIIERKIWNKSTNHFFQNTLLFTKPHLRSLLDSKPGRKSLLFKTPCSYILEVPWENFDGKIWWKSMFFKTTCPGNIFKIPCLQKFLISKGSWNAWNFLPCLSTSEISDF